MNYQYIKNFEHLGFGLFVHFGLYSCLGQGEWYLHLNPDADAEAYGKLPDKFRIKKNWARELVAQAKRAGCRYITLTTRHHDGFSLFDTRGLSDYDAPHSACGRDLIAEFVDECRKADIMPFFYHTLLDWHDPRYHQDFPAYVDYLIDSVAVLCQNYGKIGGLWFDGMWDKPDGDWQEDRLYATIRKYQPEAMIINNTGLSELGKVGHPEIDSVTFERGAPAYVDNSDRPRAGEMCQVLNDHWGYAKNDCNYKPVKELIENLIDCRKYNCNFLLNTGLLGNGGVTPLDGRILDQLGNWVKKNKGFIYGIHSSSITAQGADILEDDQGNVYAIIKDVPMSADPNVARAESLPRITVNVPIKGAVWLDNGKRIPVKDNAFDLEPFRYGESLCVRVAKLILDMER